MKMKLSILIHLDSLIRAGVTGTPNEIAEKLNLSRSYFLDIISHLRDDLFIPVVYNKKKKKYEYEHDIRFYVNEELKTALPVLEAEAVLNRIEKGEDEAVEEDELIQDEFINAGISKRYPDPDDEWYKNDSDDVILPDNINFNDLDFDY